MNVKAVVFMGRPGSGKGTQAEMLSAKSGYSIFSTGGRCREIAKEDSFLGRKIKGIIESGELTPYWFASYLFEQALLKLGPEKGIIFDGVGRKEPEARLFHDVVAWLERPYVVFYVDVSEATILGRLAKRRAIEGRKDDEDERIKTRLAAYERDTIPAIEFFKSVGTLVSINGDQAPELVHKEVMEKLAAL